MPRKNVLTEIANQAKRAHVKKLLVTLKTEAEVARHLGMSRQAVNRLLNPPKVQRKPRK